MPDAASALGLIESIEEAEDVTPLILKGTGTCPWEDLRSNKVGAGHRLPAHL